MKTQKGQVWVLAALTLGFGILAAVLLVTRSFAAPASPGAPTPAVPHLETFPKGQSPDFVYNLSLSPTCYAPVRGTGACYVRWDYIYFEAAPSQYIISMTIAIDEQPVARTMGFFQTYLYLDRNYFGKGFKVACGREGAAGVPGMGNSYRYLMRASETGGGLANTSGNVLCPADEAHIFLPAVIR